MTLGMVAPELIAAGVGTLGAALSLGLFWRSRSLHSLENARLRDHLDSRQSVLSEQISAQVSTQVLTHVAALETNLTALELSMQNADDVLREGRLNRSGRARAMQVLRSGVAPDTAASSLGIPRQDLRLLAKVSQLLSLRTQFNKPEAR